MRAIIPVAGVGTRLRPHTYTLPKVLLNVAGKPILGHILDKIIQEGITSATIIVGTVVTLTLVPALLAVVPPAALLGFAMARFRASA